MTRSTRHRTARARRHTFRPRLDALEDRQLLTAGVLDTATFNPPNGYVLTGFTAKGSTGGAANGVQVQSDGKIVVAGSGPTGEALARYNPDGSLDSTFGSGGKVQTNFAGYAYGGHQLAIQPDGKIVVIGASVLARFNPNGSPDATFGPRKNGQVTTTFSGQFDNTAAAIAIQPDGSIVVVGAKQTSSTSLIQPVVSRYTSSGTLNTSFGSGGIVTLSAYPGGGDWFVDVTTETVTVNGVPTTKIVATGPTGDSQTLLVRLNLDGSLDPTFGPNGNGVEIFNPGVLVGVSFWDLAIEPNGYIIAAGYAHPQLHTPIAFAVARFDTNGVLDPTFNAAGPVPGVTTVSASTGRLYGYRVALQPSDGKIVIGGELNYPSGSDLGDSALARINPDGTVDTTFGNGGLVIQSFSTRDDYVLGVALQADGKIVTAGPDIVNYNPSTGNYTYNFVVARFLNDTTATTSSAVASASTTGLSSLLASRSLNNPVAPSPAVFDQALAMAALDPAFGPTGPVAAPGDVGLPPSRPRVGWSPQPRWFGQP